MSLVVTSLTVLHSMYVLLSAAGVMRPVVNDPEVALKLAITGMCVCGGGTPHDDAWS